MHLKEIRMAGFVLWVFTKTITRRCQKRKEKSIEKQKKKEGEVDRWGFLREGAPLCNETIGQRERSLKAGQRSEGGYRGGGLDLGPWIRKVPCKFGVG